MAADEAERVQALVREHSPYLSFEPDGRVKCAVNGHCFVPRHDVIAAFVKWVGVGCTRHNPVAPLG